MIIDKKIILEKMNYIIFSISFGLVLWLICESVVAYSRTVDSEWRKSFIGIIGYFALRLLPLHFVSLVFNKIQWKPFGKYSKPISFFISIAVVIFLFYKIGMFKITIL